MKTFHTWWQRLTRAWRQGLRDRRGSALDDLVMVVGVTILGAVFTVAGLEFWGAVHTRQLLQQGGQIVDRSIVSSGCFTSGAQAELDQFFKQNGLNPQLVYVNATTTPQSFGSRNLSATLGYDVNVYLPYSTWRVAHLYTQVVVPADQSLAVAGDGAGQTGCASNLASTFGGTDNGSASSGSGSPVTALTLSANPNPASTGGTVTLSGVADEGTQVAPSGTIVELTLNGSVVDATVGSSGAYSYDWTAPAPASYTLSAQAGLASAQTTLTVNAATAQSISIQAPGSVAVGKPFTIYATVTDQYGNPVADGTAVSLSSSDSTDIPSKTLYTSGGTVQYDVSSGITQPVSSVSVTMSSGAASQTVTIAVTAGNPQSLSLSASPTTLTAGQAVTLSGTVLGPNSTPPASGTPVTLQSQTDTVDTFPQALTNAQGHYAATATLTVAGTQQITAQVNSGGSTVTSSPVSVVVNPAAAAILQNAQATPNPVEQGAVTTFSGTLTDQYGNPEGSGVPVTISSPALSKTLNTTTGSGGGFSVPGSFQDAGTQTVTFTSNGTALNGGSLQVTVLPAGADSLTATPSSATFTAGGSVTATWTLLNSQGQPVANEPIAFSLGPSVSGAVTPTSATTNGYGQVTVTVGPLTTAQNYTLTATATQMSNVTGTMGITVTAKTSGLTVSNPSISPTAAQSTQDGGTIDPVITGTVLDQYGNVVANEPVTVTGGWDSGVNFTGTTNKAGEFSVALNPVDVGGRYHPIITIGSGTAQTYTSTSLDVVNHLYGLVVTSSNGSNSTPAGTPYGVTVQLYKYGAGSALPEANAQVTLTVPSGDTASTWGTSSSPPTPSSPTSITVTTNSSGTATAEVAFMPNTGNDTVQASWPTDHTVGTLGVSVGANIPSTVYWDQAPSPNPQTAGQAFSFGAQLVDSSGFGLSNGQSVTLGYAGAPNVTLYTGYGNGVYGWMSGSMTSTRAGTNWVVVQNVNGTGYNGSGQPYLPSASETIDPAAMEYFYPVLSNNGGSSWLSGASWTNPHSPSQGPTNNYGWRPPLAYQGTKWYSLAGFGVDQYGNSTGGSATVTCSTTGGGTCPAMPSTANGGWQSTGGYPAGNYRLTFTPASSSYPAGVASNAETTYLTIDLPGITNIVDGGNPNYGQTPTITIDGNGFQGGTFNGTSTQFKFVDSTRSWMGGYSGNGVTANVTTWTSNAVVLSGFGGSYGSPYVFDPGDWFNINIKDPVGAWLSGSDQCPPTLITSVQAYGGGKTTEYVVNGQQFGSWPGGTSLSNYVSPWTTFQDETRGWAGWHSQTGVDYGTITKWTSTQIVFNPGFGPGYGGAYQVYTNDGVNITVWNPQTNTSSGYNFHQP